MSVENVRKEIANQFNTFENIVIRPFAEELKLIDPNVIVLNSGSYAKNQNVLRNGSDYDLLVISRSLLEQDLYIETLKQLRTKSQMLSNDYLIGNYYFTRVEKELDFNYIFKRHQQFKKIVPCHFLFYGSPTQMQQREPSQLLTRLLHHSKIIVGTKPDLIPKSPDTYPDSLTQLRWDLERYVADFILNAENFPLDYNILNYVHNVIRSIRLNGDQYFNNDTDGEFPLIINQLFPDNPNIFEPFLNIYREQSDANYTAYDLLIPVTKTIEKIDNLSL